MRVQYPQAVTRGSAIVVGLLCLLCSRGACSQLSDETSFASIDDTFVVDCLLPGKVRRLGKHIFVGPREPIKTTARDCGERGGEYTVFDRSDYETARAIWQKQADRGDPEAQNYLGEIYMRGLGVPPDYVTAASWFRRAAEQSFPAALVNLGKLYEEGLGVSPDKQKALDLYRSAIGASNLVVADVTAESPSSNNEASQVQNPGLYKDIEFGNYHALVIGNSRYQFLPELASARNDADAVAEVLSSKYGFEVTRLYDATRYGILTALNDLRKTLSDADNLLVYYAGHSDLDSINDRGYWLPVDATSDDNTNWISNVALTDMLDIMVARQVLVVADAAYSGALSRSIITRLRPDESDDSRETYYRTAAKLRSRLALTSGSLSPVLDPSSNGQSLFASALVDALVSNKGILDGERLFQELVTRLNETASAQGPNPVPQYAPIPLSGHGGGNFFFVPRT